MHFKMSRHLDEDPTGLCIIITIETARRLICEGKRPWFLWFQEWMDDGDGTLSTRPLRPLLYDSRFEMGGHRVCCCSEMAYDPFIGSPTLLVDYSRKAFGEDILVREDTRKERRMIADITSKGDFSSMCRYLNLSFDCS